MSVAMELRDKPDFDKTLQRFEAWWHCQIIDRPPVSPWVKSDRPAGRERKAPRRQYATLRERWMDIDYILDCHEAWLEGAMHLGDSFPAFMPNLGPEVCATVFGCELEFGQDTSWSIPAVGSCREISGIRPNLDNPYWNWIRRATDESLRRGRGRWITAMPDLHMDGDLLASLRDPQNLCLDLVDDPDSVRQACDYVTQHYPVIFDDIWGRIAAAGQPGTTWTAYLHSGRAYVTSCDFICMISPEMFQRTILPSIQWEMDWLERNIFHLDGPGALKHLDTLLAQPRLTGLQWIYGASRGPAAKWVDVYKKAQAAGKCIQLCGEGLEDTRKVAEQLRPEGVWLCPGGGTRDEVQAFLDWAGRWAAGRQ